MEYALSSGPSPPPQRTSSCAPQPKPQAPLEPSFDLGERTVARVHTLIAEGALRRACTALTADPPVSPTPAVIDERRLLLPGHSSAPRYDREASSCQPWCCS